jgi:hypothetical protein
MSLVFKYQKDYDKLTQVCPPADYTSQNLNPVYRWVFDFMDDEWNFLSQFHKKPKRFLNRDDITKCNAMALSMFNNLEGSIERFQELKEDMGDNIHGTLGTKVAIGKITLTDGVNGKIERLGHFNHHPSTTATYHVSFTLTDSIL